MITSNISFIIPAYNEEKYIYGLIHSIHHNLKEKIQYEIIVIDNGSEDNTIKIAQDNGAKVFQKLKGTIGSLRNYGAFKAQSGIYIFLDADILITPKWAKRFEEIYNKLKENPNTLTGSWVGVEENCSWIEKYWFKPLSKDNPAHVNSGHMIITKKVFDMLAGFDEHLETGEDYDISIRAFKLNVNVYNDPALFVIHKGYPKSLRQFCRREAWHGKGDYSNLNMFFHSKVAQLSIIFLLLNFSCFLSFIMGNYVLGSLSFLLITILCFSSALIKYRKDPIITKVINSFLFYAYFGARAYSIFHILKNKSKKEHYRN